MISSLYELSSVSIGIPYNDSSQKLLHLPKYFASLGVLRPENRKRWQTAQCVEIDSYNYLQ